MSVLRVFAGITFLLVQMSMAAIEHQNQGDARVRDIGFYTLSPFNQDKPIKVKVALDLFDISRISDAHSTLDFTG